MPRHSKRAVRSGEQELVLPPFLDFDTFGEVHRDLDSMMADAFEFIVDRQAVSIVIEGDRADRNHRAVQSPVSGVRDNNAVTFGCEINFANIWSRVVSQAPEKCRTDEAVDFFVVNIRRVVKGRAPEAVSLSIVSGVYVCPTVADEMRSVKNRLERQAVVVAVSPTPSQSQRPAVDENVINVIAQNLIPGLPKGAGHGSTLR